MRISERLMDDFLILSTLLMALGGLYFARIGWTGVALVSFGGCFWELFLMFTQYRHDKKKRFEGE